MRRKGLAMGIHGLTMVGIILLVSLVSACGGSSSTTPSTPSAQGSPNGATPTTSAPTPTPISRHGLPMNVPLPDGISFNAQSVYVLYNVANVHTSSVTIGCYGRPTNATWIWTVASPANPTSIDQMYVGILASKGWSFVHSWAGCLGGNPVVSACEGSGSQQQVLLISIGTSLTVVNIQTTPVTTVNAPSGGTVLAIAIVPAEHGQIIPGTADVFCR
jgi:hypothetical protein